MANLSKMRRDKLIAYIEKLKQEHTDDESLILFNELENALTEKRYGLVFEEHTEEVDELLAGNVPVLTADPTRRLCKDESLPWNFIIEGDNLQALYLLEKTHKGKVDCIYIDPPYNTGAKDWKYNNDYVDGNDTYRHSKWLSMMKNRLQIAKNLLNPDDSVLIATIDEKEYLRLGCLLEEMFPNARIQMVSSVINHAGVTIGDSFSRSNEFIFFVKFGSAAPAALSLSSEWRGNTKSEKKEKLVWNQLMRSGTGVRRADRPNMFYPLFVNEKGTKIVSVGEAIPLGIPRDTVQPLEGTRVVWPIRSNGEEGRWRIGRENLIEITKKGYVRLGSFTQTGMAITYLASGEQEKVEAGIFPIIGHREDGSIIEGEMTEERRFIPGSQWDLPSHNATYQGSQLLNKVLGESRFSFPKSLYAVHDAIRFFVANKPHAIIVDFFAGSGTTLHAINLLNAEDGGQRTCVMVTNNEVSIEEEKDFAKRGIIKGSEEWEARGIAKFVTWPRTVCSINGVDVNGNVIKGNYLDSDRPMAEGFKANVKFFKCEWVPRISDDSLAEQLMAHVKEMIELEHAIEVDGKRIVIVLSEEEADFLEQQWNSFPQLEHLYIAKGVLLTTKQNELFNTVEMHTIPDYYFDIELKEVGESW